MQEMMGAWLQLLLVCCKHTSLLRSRKVVPLSTDLCDWVDMAIRGCPVGNSGSQQVHLLAVDLLREVAKSFKAERQAWAAAREQERARPGNDLGFFGSGYD
jgi:hypothetical protein